MVSLLASNLETKRRFRVQLQCSTMFSIKMSNPTTVAFKTISTNYKILHFEKLSYGFVIFLQIYREKCYLQLQCISLFSNQTGNHITFALKMVRTTYASFYLGKSSNCFVNYFKFANEEVTQNTATTFYFVYHLNVQSCCCRIRNDAYNSHRP